MKQIENATFERYTFGDYIVEVEEKPDGVIDFWLYKDGFGVKEYVFGIPLHQPHAKDGKTEYTKAEALDMAFCQMDDYIADYREQYEDDDE